jgi:hypothetical protein
MGSARRGRFLLVLAALGAERPDPLRIAAALLALLLLAGCESVPEVGSPRSYSRDGISFSYPANWSVTEDVVQPGEPRYRYLFVESPGSALVVVQVYEPGLDLSVQDFAAEFSRRTAEETEDLARLGPLEPIRARTGGAVPVRAVVAGASRVGVEQWLSVSAAGQDVPHKLRAFRVETPSATVFLVVQASLEDWSLVAPGFDLVLESFEVE